MPVQLEEKVPAVLVWVLTAIVLFDVLFVGVHVLATRAWEADDRRMRRRH